MRTTTKVFLSFWRYIYIYNETHLTSQKHFNLPRVKIHYIVWKFIESIVGLSTCLPRDYHAVNAWSIRVYFDNFYKSNLKLICRNFLKIILLRLLNVNFGVCLAITASLGKRIITEIKKFFTKKLNCNVTIVSIETT